MKQAAPTTDSSGAYTLDLPIGTYHVQVVDLVVATPDYQPTWIGGVTPAVVKIAQGGTLTVGGAFDSGPKSSRRSKVVHWKN